MPLETLINIIPHAHWTSEAYNKAMQELDDLITEESKKLKLLIDFDQINLDYKGISNFEIPSIKYIKRVNLGVMKITDVKQKRKSKK